MTANPEPNCEHPAARGKAPWIVRLAVIVALMLTMLTVGLVGWRWYHVRFPNAALFVRGDASTNGTEVLVGNERGHQIFTGRLSPDNEYQLVVLVEQGVYNIQARQDGKLLVRDRLYVPNGGGVLLNVKQPATQPATRPAPLPASSANEDR